MTDPRDTRRRILELPPKRLALLALELQEELDRLREARSEPIAIVGMACRFPGGANSLEEYWALLREGRDAIAEVPPDRWSLDELYDPDPEAPGCVSTRWGGFLDDIQRFDAAFFSISPREAIAMDPQQRLLLEVTWRAFEDANIPPARYYGRRAGVFIGICNSDYLNRLLVAGTDVIDPYFATGAAYSVAAGRLSFTFGFEGPAVSVDTACSSSLVAIHQAIQSLRSGDTDLAVAGGVNALCSPETQIALSRARMMAADGRCKTFDDRADGFVRAEGCGVLILKRLSDALRAGDHIRGVLRGSALGQDGRSSGLTVPNGPAQEDVIRLALRDAALERSDVDYVEAHGTGTSLGDPIEIRALGRVFGPGREHPLIVGSVKTNFGHLESAAGVAGLIKTVLALEHQWIPKHLHFRTPSTLIEWDDYPIHVPADGAEWKRAGRARSAGVSSFGFSGTNAHVVVQEAPPVQDVGPSGVAAPQDAGLGEERPEVLVVSGFTPEARDEIWRSCRTALDERPQEWRDICHTARVGRSALGWRCAVVLSDPQQVGAAVDGGASAPEVFASVDKVSGEPEVAFVFTGQGAQHPGMGRDLYRSERVFREAIDRCAAALDPSLPMPLTEILFAEGGADAAVYRTALAQPAVVAYEWALSEQLQAWGIRPAAVIGHSLGEFVAATVAGVLALEEMLELVRTRGTLLDSLPGGDRMAAVFAAAESLEPLLAAHGRDVVIGAYNAPESTVLSGPAPAVDAVLEAAATRGIESRILRLDKAFHSPGVAPILGPLRAAAERASHAPPRIPIAWNVTGQLGGVEAPRPDYWCDHAAKPVRFMQGIRSLATRVRNFVEVGPHPTLSPLVAQTLDKSGAVVVPCQHRDADQRRALAETAARLWVRGVNVDWEAADRDRGLRRVAIPGHPLRGDRYWVDTSRARRPRTRHGSVPGVALEAAVPIFETVFTPSAPGFLDEHRFRGDCVVPGPLLVELAMAAAARTGRVVDGATAVRFVAPVVVREEGVRIQTLLESERGEIRFRVLSAPPVEKGVAWTEHASGTLRRVAVPAESAPAPSSGWSAVPIEEHLARLAALGFSLGRSVALYEDAEVSGRTARARLRVAGQGTDPAVARALTIDAAIQVLGIALAAEAPGEARMLASIESVARPSQAHRAVACVATLQEFGRDGSVRGDVHLLDAGGATVTSLHGARLVPLRSIARADASWFHELRWIPSEAPSQRHGETWTSSDLARAAAELGEAWEEISAEADLPAFVAALPGLRRWVAAEILAALEGMGLESTERIGSPAELAEALRIAPAQRRLVPRLLEILAEERLIDSTLSGGERGRSGASSRRPARPESSLSLRAGSRPSSTPSVDALLARCVAHLPEVLQGTVDPVSLLFPGGDSDPTRRVYAESPFGRAFNAAIRVVVDALTAGKDGRELRVLEIGAGSGSTTQAVLAALGTRPCRYSFTDVSPSLVERARRTLGSDGRLHFQVLDLEVRFGGQGIPPGTQDAVIAANVVHATRDLRSSLEHLHEALAPGGVLLLLEGSRRESWVDVTFGLTEGWWRFTDRELRPDYPVISAARWHEVLEQVGFTDVQALPEQGEALGQVLLIARKGARTVAEPIVSDARGQSPSGLLAVLKDHTASVTRAPLWIITEAAQRVGHGDTPDPDAAILWGLARTFALEHPDLWGGIVDLPVGVSAEEATDLVQRSIAAADAEDQVAWRQGTRFVPRLERTDAPFGELRTLDGGTYLVTGGLGGLGLKVARWLAQAGASHIVLVGRSDGRPAWPADDPRRADFAALAEAGATAVVRAVDITDREALDALLAELRETAPPLRGIVHAAAVFEAGTLASLGADALERVLAPKVSGTRNLVALTRSDPLDFVVLFSSTTSILGVAGLGAYAAANQFLDAFAWAARSEGVPAISVNWGIWDVMRLASAEEQERYAQAGLRPMPTAAALQAMGALVSVGAANAVVADADWERLRSVYEARRPRPLLHSVGGASPGDEGGREPSAGPLSLGGLGALPAEERTALLLDAIEEEVRGVLRLPADAPLSRDGGFFEMGMDSLMSVELKTRLEKRLGTDLPATLTFNYPSVHAVGAYVEGLVPTSPEAPETAEAPGSEVDDDRSEAELAEMLERRLRSIERR